MIPEAIECEDCGRRAIVRGYGRVTYDWTDDHHGPTTLKIKSVHLTVDCPRCGVRVQEYCPVEQPA